MIAIDKYSILIYNHIKSIVFICVLLSIEKCSVKRRKITCERYKL